MVKNAFFPHLVQVSCIRLKIERLLFAFRVMLCVIEYFIVISYNSVDRHRFLAALIVERRAFAMIVKSINGRKGTFKFASPTDRSQFQSIEWTNIDMS